MRVDPFAIAVPDAVLTDLRERIARTRWPDPAPGEAWSQGVEVGYLRELLAYWADGFEPDPAGEPVPAAGIRPPRQPGPE